MTTGSPIIETRQLGRDFKVREGVRRRTLTAVDDLAITIQAGEAVGYIGANGAGKSTTIKMLCGILVPTRGTVTTCGLRPVADRRELARQVGVVFGQRTQLWWDLPVRESFTILAAIHGLSRVAETARTEELVERLELSEFLLSRSLSNLSDRALGYVANKESVRVLFCQTKATVQGRTPTIENIDETPWFRKTKASAMRVASVPCCSANPTSFCARSR